MSKAPQKSGDAPEGPRTGTRATHELSAHALVSSVAQQLSGLEALSERLERTLGASLCNCHEISPETIRSLQSADFIRQSVRDMRAILNTIAPNVSWREGQSLSLADLRQAVDMRDSLAGLGMDVGASTEEDIWF